jgi:hypothetical protein
MENIMKHLSPAQKQLGLRIHAIAFVVTMVVLVVVNLLTGPPYWVLWMLLGWGIGLLSHWWFGSRNDLNEASDR